MVLEQKKSLEELNNDKIRTKMINQTKKYKDENGNSKSPFHKALKEQINDAALIPDIVKWTQKDLKKIMMIGKNQDEL